MASIVGDIDLLFPFMSGITAPKDFRLGVALEYFPVHLSDLSLVPYDATPGIRDILSGLASQYKWLAVYEGAMSSNFYGVMNSSPSQPVALSPIRARRSLRCGTSKGR